MSRGVETGNRLELSISIAGPPLAYGGRCRGCRHLLAGNIPPSPDFPQLERPMHDGTARDQLRRLCFSLVEKRLVERSELHLFPGASIFTLMSSS